MARLRKVRIGVLVLAVVTAFGLLLALGLYSFRDEVVDNPELGIMRYSYSWGRRTWLAGDSNRDGQVDTRTRLDTETGNFPEEFWEDRDFNGIFEVHVVMNAEVIDVIEVDANQDGEYEIRATGDEAKAVWEQITSNAPRAH